MGAVLLHTVSVTSRMMNDSALKIMDSDESRFNVSSAGKGIYKTI